MRFSPRSQVSWIGVVLLTAWAPIARSGGTVGTGTAGSCTEAALNTALAGGGLVNFSCGASPVTIPITSVKVILASTTIDGLGTITLDGGGTTALFNVTGGGLALLRLTLTGGFSSNPLEAAVVTSSAGVTIDHSTITANTSTDVSCMAINVSGAGLAIRYSTVSNNIGSGTTGGNVICTNNTATVTVFNSTITGNTNVGGGGIWTSGTGALIFSTVANNTSHLGNSAVVAFTGTWNLTNSIVADNAGGNCAAVAGGSIVDAGHNLQYPGSSCGGTIPTSSPLLGPLASNGGLTQTMALTAGSPAFNQIPSGTGGCGTTTTIDQRDFARPDPAGGACDIGAYEAPATLNDINSVPVLGGWARLAFAVALVVPGMLLLKRLG